MKGIKLYKDVKNIIRTEEIRRSILRTEEQLNDFKSKQNILIVGSGGSYVTGLYAKDIIENNMQNLCQVFKPMEVLQTRINAYKYAIIFSYKMKGYDMKKAIDYIYDCENITKILVITAKEPKIKYNNNKITYIYYDEDSEYEKSYVSYKGIYLPVFLLGSCFKHFDEIEKNIDKLDSIRIDINNKKMLDIFYDKDNYSLAQLIERHLCELGIATVRIHEKKDFSHGRMSILNKEGEVIYLKSCNYDKKYDNMLYNYLKEIYNAKILNEKELKQNLNLDYFEKLLLALNWINECSIKHGISLNDKKDTKDDEKLFKYGEGNL